MLQVDYGRLNRSRVLAVQSIDVRRYLRGTGWQRVDEGNKPVAIFRRQIDSLPEVKVPLGVGDEEFFFRRMVEAIWDLADFEERSPHQVLENLLAGSADTLRFRIEDPATATGDIPISDGISLFEGSQKVLLASACHVVEPQTFYPRLRRSKANDYVETCRIAAEEGSFVARLVCPLEHEDEDDEQTSLSFDGAEHQTPFGRKVVRSVMTAVEELVRQTDSDRWDALEDWAEEGPLSANLCDGLLEMQPQHRQSLLDIRSDWSPAGPAEETTSRVALRQEHFDVVEHLANHLRPRETRASSSFVGTVERLNGTPNADGEMQGEVRVRVRDDDTMRTAKLALEPDDYQQAIRAHGENQSVRIKGTLHRKARVSRFSGYEELDVVEDS